MPVGCSRPSSKPLCPIFAPFFSEYSTVTGQVLHFNLDCSALFSPPEPGWILHIDLVVQRQDRNCGVPVGWARKISTFSTYRSTRTLAALHLLGRKELQAASFPSHQLFLQDKSWMRFKWMRSAMTLNLPLAADVTESCVSKKGKSVDEKNKEPEHKAIGSSEDKNTLNK